MYGMVNKFISSSIVERYGQKQWDEISDKLAFTTDNFVEMHAYSDDTTFAIVGTACEVLGVEATVLLEQLGHDWVINTSQGPYQNMYDLSGTELFDFLQNLNNMHHVISAQMPDLIPPSFLCDKSDTGLITVKYFSEREGLEHFVIGLLGGLCSLYKVKAEVAMLSTRSDEQPYSEFTISPN